MFTLASHWPLYLSILIQSRTSHLKHLEFIVILFFHLTLDILSDFFLFVFDRVSSVYVDNINDQLDIVIKTLLIFESAQHVSGNFCPSSGA